MISLFSLTVFCALAWRLRLGAAPLAELHGEPPLFWKPVLIGIGVGEAYRDKFC